MKMFKKVSILIPAYNAEQWIGLTLESALKQITPKKEIIVVDDGSTDRTLKIAKRYESRLLKVIHQENQGARCGFETFRRVSMGAPGFKNMVREKGLEEASLDART